LHPEIYQETFSQGKDWMYLFVNWYPSDAFKYCCGRRGWWSRSIRSLITIQVSMNWSKTWDKPIWGPEWY